jgi:putative transposase
MPQSRKTQVSLIDTPFLALCFPLCTAFFLCGKDKFTGQSYEPRRGWIEERLLFSSSVFRLVTRLPHLSLCSHE